MSFKDNLKNELTYQDILVKELADRTGIAKRTIDNYLREKSSIPPADAAVKIARALNVSVEYLITGENKFDFTELTPVQAELLKVFDSFSPEKQSAIIQFLAQISKKS